MTCNLRSISYFLWTVFEINRSERSVWIVNLISPSENERCNLRTVNSSIRTVCDVHGTETVVSRTVTVQVYWTTPLADRFREHRRDVINRRNDLPVPSHVNQANHTLEDLKVAVFKAGLTNQEYCKKQEMHLIFKYGTVTPSGLNNQGASFTCIIHFLPTRALTRAATCDTRPSV